MNTIQKVVKEKKWLYNKTESVKWSYIYRQQFFLWTSKKKTANFEEFHFFSLFLWKILQLRQILIRSFGILSAFFLSHQDQLEKEIYNCTFQYFFSFRLVIVLSERFVERFQKMIFTCTIKYSIFISFWFSEEITFHIYPYKILLLFAKIIYFVVFCLLSLFPINAEGKDHWSYINSSSENLEKHLKERFA